MILLFLNQLKFYFHIKVPAVFYYTSTRMLLASLTALILSILLGPYFIRKLYEFKIGQTIRTDECPLLGSLHRNKNSTPTMGGILILFSMLISLFLWMDLTSIYTWILLFTTLSLGIVGGYDDFLKLKHKNTKGLSGKKKLLFQALISICIGSYFLFPLISQEVDHVLQIREPVVKEKEAKQISLKNYMNRFYVPFKKEPLLNLGIIASFIWITFVITGASNSVNLTDGLDGLASGCLIMVASVFALIAFVSNNIEVASYLNVLYIEGSGEIAIYLLACIGALLGFLWYNGHPAQIFMGDIGSLTLGGIIGVSAVLLKKEMLLGIAGGVFVIEALSVIIQVASFKLRRERVFLCAPLHHHFEYKGWPETKVVTRFWIISLIFAFFGLATLKFQ
ncbi:phospho-N-acetylmuramoyl-pentapeptide-transferase [Chlamydiales bacterium]|nr:phospho-N-acetylmuramoyl-pentapeptide-transferase [Chlamydiales bacterium]